MEAALALVMAVAGELPAAAEVERVGHSQERCQQMEGTGTQ